MRRKATEMELVSATNFQEGHHPRKPSFPFHTLDRAKCRCWALLMEELGEQ